MKRYLAYNNHYVFKFNKPGIYAIEIEKETPKMFYYKGRRHPGCYNGSSNDFYSLHSTKAEAIISLSDYANNEKDDLQRHIKRKQKEIVKWNELIDKLKLMPEQSA